MDNSSSTGATEIAQLNLFEEGLEAEEIESDIGRFLMVLLKKRDLILQKIFDTLSWYTYYHKTI